MALAPGRYEIDGDRLFLNVMDMTTHGFEGSTRRFMRSMRLVLLARGRRENWRLGLYR